MLPRIGIPRPDPWARCRDQPPYSSTLEFSLVNDRVVLLGHQVGEWVLAIVSA